MQEPETLGHRLLDEKINACDVAARSREATDKAKFNRVLADAEDDRNHRCCSFGCACGQGAGRGDHGDLSADQIGQQRRQAIILTLKPMILDSHILAFDIAAFVEAFAKRGHITLGAIGRPVSNKRYHRQRRLLGVSSERPPRHRAAEKRDELAPSHCLPPR